MRVADRSALDADPRGLGALAVAVLGAAVLLALGVGLRGWGSPTYEVRAVFDDAGGLRAGSAVTVAGVEVGTVRAIDGDFGRGLVVATLELERGVDVPADTRAEIGFAGLFSGYRVSLTGPGSGSGSGELLAELPDDERVIPLAATTVNVGLVDALDEVTTGISGLDQERIGATLQLAGDVFGATADELVPLFEGLDEVTTVLEGGAGDLAELAEASRTIATLVVDSGDELDQLVAAAQQLLGELADRRDQLEVVLGTGHDLVVRLTSLLEERADQLRRLSGEVHDLVAVVGPRAADIDRALATIGPAFEGLARAGNTDRGWVDFVSPSFGPITTGDDRLLPPGGSR